VRLGHETKINSDHITKNGTAVTYIVQSSPLQRNALNFISTNEARHVKNMGLILRDRASCTGYCNLLIPTVTSTLLLMLKLLSS
jgi:hypothetical protein